MEWHRTGFDDYGGTTVARLHSDRWRRKLVTPCSVFRDYSELQELILDFICVMLICRHNNCRTNHRSRTLPTLMASVERHSKTSSTSPYALGAAADSAEDRVLRLGALCCVGFTADIQPDARGHGRSSDGDERIAPVLLQHIQRWPRRRTAFFLFGSFLLVPCC